MYQQNILAWRSVLSLVDNESQRQHTACWQRYNTDSRTAQEAASVMTQTKLFVLRQPCNLNIADLLYHYVYYVYSLKDPCCKSWMHVYCFKSRS